MRELVETYRGVTIYKSDVVFCDPAVTHAVAEPCEAELDGRRMVGTLLDIKGEIDRRLGLLREGGSA